MGKWVIHGRIERGKCLWWQVLKRKIRGGLWELYGE